MAKKATQKAEDEVAVTTHRLRYATLLAGALMLFSAALILSYHRPLAGWEYTWLTAINGWSDSWRIFFLAATITANALWFGAASIVVAYLLRLYRLAWSLAAVIMAGTGLVLLIKHFLGRARPEALTNDITVRVAEGGMGFPSGHVMMITVVTLTLFPYLPRGWRLLVLLLIPLMAWSRIYLGVHTPLDVIGGFALGVATVSLVRVLPAAVRRLLRFE